jgi:hypothetical protein
MSTTITVQRRKGEDRDQFHERAKRAAARAVSPSPAAHAYTWREDSHARDHSTAIYQATVTRTVCNCGSRYRHRRHGGTVESVLGEVWVVCLNPHGAARA